MMIKLSFPPETKLFDCFMKYKHVTVSECFFNLYDSLPILPLLNSLTTISFPHPITKIVFLLLNANAQH